MLRHCRCWGFVLALSSLLGAGCGSVIGTSHPKQAGAAATAPQSQSRQLSGAPNSASGRRNGVRRSGDEPGRPQSEAAIDPAAEAVACAHAHYAAGVIHEMNDEPDLALQEYGEAALADPGNDWLVLETSRRLLQQRPPQLDKALELLNRAAALTNASGAILARQGLVYSQLGKYDLAAAADRAAIKRAPDALGGYQNLFLNCLQNKQEAEALKVLDEAARQPGVNAEFLISLAELYGNYVVQVPAQKQKVHAKALAVLKRAADLNPSSPTLRLRLADNFNLVGDSTTASQLYLELLKKLPDVPLVRQRIHANLADIYLRDKDHRRAIEQLKAILRDDPTNPEACYYLGYLAYDDKKPAEAVDYFNKTILLQPNFAEAYYDLALAQLELNKADDALATLARARQKFSKSFLLEFWTAMAYTQKKAYAEAIPHFTEAEVIAQATSPKRLNEQFFFQVGAAHERVGDYAQAEECFQKCLKLAPDFAEALNYLGYMWAERGTNLVEAQRLIEKAVKVQPKNPAYLDSLGWVLYKLGQPKEALPHLLKAVELSPEPDPTLYDHLGDIYAALKQAEQARAAWTKSLALEANDRVRQKLEPQIEPAGEGEMRTLKR